MTQLMVRNIFLTGGGKDSDGHKIPYDLYVEWNDDVTEPCELGLVEISKELDEKYKLSGGISNSKNRLASLRSQQGFSPPEFAMAESSCLTREACSVRDSFLTSLPEGFLTSLPAFKICCRRNRCAFKIVKSWTLIQDSFALYGHPVPGILLYQFSGKIIRVIPVLHVELRLVAVMGAGRYA